MSTAADRGGAERRRHPRRNIIGRELVTAELNSGGALVLDVGEGGVAVQPFAPVSPGDTSQVRFRLPETEESFSGTGMVAWVGRGGRAGIRFINVPEEARTHLRQWLKADIEGETDVTESAPVVPEPEHELDLEGVLQMTAERARTITAANGIAIALGDATGMTCQIALGDAPDPGARLSPDSGLTGYCLRSGATMHCADTQKDPRVDAVAAQRLRARSVVVVPVLAGGNLIGVMVVLADAAMAFATRHVERLERLAELLGNTLEHIQKRADTTIQQTATEAAKVPPGSTIPQEWPISASPLAALPEIILASDAACANSMTASSAVQELPQVEQTSPAVAKNEAATNVKPVTADAKTSPAAKAGANGNGTSAAANDNASAATDKEPESGNKSETPIEFFETYAGENQAQRVLSVFQKYWNSRSR